MRYLLIFLGVIVVLAVIGMNVRHDMPKVQQVDGAEMTIDIPAGQGYGGSGFGRRLDLSSDGKKIVYVGTSYSTPRLFLQMIGDPPVAIEGTDGAADPAFSPDGRSIVFYQDNALKKVDLGSSVISVVAKTHSPRGVAWLDAETLIVGNTQGSLLRVPAGGGEMEPLVQVMGPHLPHLSPWLLPGNKAVLFTLAEGSLQNARIGVMIIQTGEERQLLDENGFSPRYVPTGQLVYAQGNAHELMAVRLDPITLKTDGTAVRILDAPLSGQGSGGSTDYAFSTNGILVYTRRTEDSIDDVFAAIGNVDLTQIYLRPHWFDELRRLVP